MDTAPGELPLVDGVDPYLFPARGRKRVLAHLGLGLGPG